jgi:hypothetical protein
VATCSTPPLPSPVAAGHNCHRHPLLLLTTASPVTHYPQLPRPPVHLLTAAAVVYKRCRTARSPHTPRSLPPYGPDKFVPSTSLRTSAGTVATLARERTLSSSLNGAPLHLIQHLPYRSSPITSGRRLAPGKPRPAYARYYRLRWPHWPHRLSKTRFSGLRQRHTAAFRTSQRTEIRFDSDVD